MTDETLSIDILYADENLPDELYKLVRDNLIDELEKTLAQCSRVIDQLRIVIPRRNGKLSLLMAASLFGHDDIVRLLLKYNSEPSQVEVEGEFCLADGKKFTDTTALYCACYSGHFHVAKTLIELGNANVYQKTNEYPRYSLLLSAVKNNRFDIVQFLIGNNYSDANEKTNGFCPEQNALLIAVTQNHLDQVKYLIEHGANVNDKCLGIAARCETALTVAIKNESIELCDVLLEAGASVTDISLVKTIFYANAFSIAEFLLEKSVIHPNDIELFISAIDSTEGNLIKSYKLMKTSFAFREKKGLKKLCPESKSFWNNERECQTMEEFESIFHDEKRRKIEYLLIQNRLRANLKDVTIFRSLENYAVGLGLENKFDQCFDFCLYIHEIDEQMEANFGFHVFIWLFCRIIRNEEILSVKTFLRVANLVFRPSYHKRKEKEVNNVLFLLVISSKILEQNRLDESEREEILRWIRNVCRRGFVTSHGNSLIHLALDERTNYNLNYRSSEISQTLKFPDKNVVELILTQGRGWIDVNFEDSSKNRPLNVACQQRKIDLDIIETLIKAGAHVDALNQNGLTAFDRVFDVKVEHVLREKFGNFSLKCLCARTINEFKLKFDVPQSLKKFVALHSVDST